MEVEGVSSLVQREEVVCMHALISMTRSIVNAVYYAISDVGGREQQLLLA